jgi:hypothetical protein
MIKQFPSQLSSPVIRPIPQPQSLPVDVEDLFMQYTQEQMGCTTEDLIERKYLAARQKDRQVRNGCSDGACSDTDGPAKLNIYVK